MSLLFLKIEDIQSIYTKRYWNNIIQWLIKALLEKQIILFPLERYFVPTTYYIIPTRSVFLFPHDIILLFTLYLSLI